MPFFTFRGTHANTLRTVTAPIATLAAIVEGTRYIISWDGKHYVVTHAIYDSFIGALGANHVDAFHMTEPDA